MNLRTTLIDFAARPGLLGLRERARGLYRVALGTKTRIQTRYSKNLVPGMLSIVVPMYGVERYIEECLSSLRKQNYSNVQIVVVDDGSPDDSYDIAKHIARLDPRILIVRQPNGGLSAARNTGVRHAKGEYLAFLDSDDFVDRHAYSEAVAALVASHSDFAVMPYRREKNGTYPGAAPWIRNAHAVKRLGTNIEEFPEIMVNAVAWSKVYRRSFWDAQGFTFPVGMLYEDQAMSMSAYASATSFDVLSRVSINWRIRGDQSSITQQVTSARNIADHAVAVRDSLTELERFGHVDAARMRTLQILNNNLGEFLPNIRQMDDVAWRQFRDFLEMVVTRVTETEWNAIEVRKKCMIRLCLLDERNLALRFLEAGGWERDHFPGHITGHHLVADLPLADELKAVVKPEDFLFNEAETQLTVVSRFMRQNADRFTIEAFAYINHLRMAEETTIVHAFLVSPEGMRSELTVERFVDAWSASGHTRRYTDMSTSAISVEIAKSQVSEQGHFEIEFEMECGELKRTALLSTDGRSTFPTPVEVEPGKIVTFERNKDNVASIHTHLPQVFLRDVSFDGATVSFELESSLELTHLKLQRRGDRFQLQRGLSALTPLENNRFSGQIKLPSRGPEGLVDYHVFATEKDGPSFEPVYTGGAEGLKATGLNISPRFQNQNAKSGTVFLTDLGIAAKVTNIEFVEDSLHITFSDNHIGSPMVSARSRIGSTKISSAVVRDSASSRIELSMTQDSWGLGKVGIKSGRCHLAGRTATGEKIPLFLSNEMVAQLPLDLDHDVARMSVRRSKGGMLNLEVLPPLLDAERGGGDRWRMRDWFLTLTPTEPRSILFRNLYGEAANDSALAVYDELKRRGSELEMLWAVKDRSVWVPEGATAVLEESREYYEAFGTASYVMANVHQPNWYHKPEGQVLIETFHGYPFKLNGRRWWEKLGFPAERQESFFKRAEEWDYLVSPAQYATPFLKEFFREGATPETKILEIGYPRNDQLINHSAELVRERTRANLGIPSGKKVILYAPTFRDYLSGDDMTAKLVDLLDPEKLLADLGPDYTLLMRGHPFNARTGTKVSSAFINVTDYPDINHLILASDMGIMDYSSLRFDYALSGKPSLYFVPDADLYFDGRESFVPYVDTSPGPHLRNHAELVAGIQNVNQYAEDFEPARQRFLNTYMELEDGHAAARLVDTVFVPRGDARKL